MRSHNNFWNSINERKQNHCHNFEVHTKICYIPYALDFYKKPLNYQNWVKTTSCNNVPKLFSVKFSFENLRKTLLKFFWLDMNFVVHIFCLDFDEYENVTCCWTLWSPRSQSPKYLKEGTKKFVAGCPSPAPHEFLGQTDGQFCICAK